MTPTLVALMFAFVGQYTLVSGPTDYCGTGISLARITEHEDRADYMLSFALTTPEMRIVDHLFYGEQPRQWSYGTYIKDTHSVTGDAILSVQKAKHENGLAYRVVVQRRISIIPSNSKEVAPGLKIEFAKRSFQFGGENSVTCIYKNAMSQDPRDSGAN